MHEQALEALPSETGGFLLGSVGHDSGSGTWHIRIDEAVPLHPLEQNPTYFSFTWRDVDQVRRYREETGTALVGWYHTHPDMGIFLSETDLDKTHRVLFSEPFQVALVYDPVKSRAGYFFWEGPQVIDANSADWREFEIAMERSSEEFKNLMITMEDEGYGDPESRSEDLKESEEDEGGTSSQGLE
jgi:proteasome lid subunit RPN8/RPN11